MSVMWIMMLEAGYRNTAYELLSLEQVGFNVIACIDV